MLPNETIDSIRKKLKRPIPMRGLERRVYGAVILLLMCGILWSILLHDWQYFERSGSLVVVVAIALGWRDHVSLLGNVKNIYQAQFDRLLAKLDATRPSGIVAGAIHDKGRQDIEAASMNVEELISLLRRRLRTTEVAILCLGTIVWGYGSVIGNLIWCFSNAQKRE
jgi:hypothetical protein